AGNRICSLFTSQQTLEKVFLLHFQKSMGYILAQQTIDRIAVSLSSLGFRIENDRLPLVGRFQYSLRFWNNTQERDSENFFYIANTEHLTLLNTLGVVAG